MRLILIVASVLPLTACGISGPANVEGLSTVLGDALPGAQGKTLADQEKIDVTVARACAANVFNREKCDEHTIASADRRRELPRRIIMEN